MSNMIFNNKIIKILEVFRGDYYRKIYGRDIANRLKMNQKTVSNILNKLEREDILKFSPPAGKYKLVANIPYEITSAILQKFLTCVSPPEEMVLLVQKEVAERITELKKRSLLNISVWLYGEPEVVATVPATSFYPEPKVTSAILRIKIKNLSAETIKNNEKALRIAKIGFISPRKKLINNLSAGLAMPKENLAPVFDGLGLDENIRAEELEPSDWLGLEGELKNMV